MALSQQIEIENPEMNSLIFYLIDRWALIGFSGVLLNIVSLLKEADLPEVTGFSGLLIVLVAIFQKVRSDIRKQQKHNLLMRMMQKMERGEMDFDRELFSEFMQNDK